MTIIAKPTLRVTDAVRDDEYKDIVRVHWRHRGRPTTKVGTLVKISFVRDNDRVTRIFAIRGLDEKQKDEIRIDHVNRNEMKLQVGETREFTIETTRWWEKVWWACTATDPGARIAAWIAVISTVIGIVGLLLAVIGLYPIIKEIRADLSGPTSSQRPAASTQPIQHPAPTKESPRQN